MMFGAVAFAMNQPEDVDVNERDSVLTHEPSNWGSVTEAVTRGKVVHQY